MSSSVAYFQRLKDSILFKSPYCSGVSSLPSQSFVLYYGKGDNARQIDLSAASESELEHLSKACQPATFGVDQQDILDESYRKAGKMDTSGFASKFNLERSRILELIIPSLLEGHDGKKTIEAELYKLNVYGKDSFFKAHKDTPRGEKMFASLVVVFPTIHDGGSLVLRQHGNEWTFDSAKEVHSQPTPSIAYIAFYSDIEHEVMPVTTGYRVTLTYNLYFSTRDPPTAGITSPSEVSFKSTLSELLNNPDFLSGGGHIGFGLRQQYPINSESQTEIGTLLGYLKGSDAIVKNVCDSLSLACKLQFIYAEGRQLFKADCEIDLSNFFAEDESIESKIQAEGGIRIYNGRDTAELSKPGTVWWVTPLTGHNTVQTPYVAYGNEASLEFIYGQLALIVEVGPATSRETA